MLAPNFQELMKTIRYSKELGHYQGQIHESWLQGRTAFGGLLGAFAIAATRKTIEKDRPLRSLTMAFIGPAKVGEIEIHCDLYRQGRSVTWAGAKIIQDGKLCSRVDMAYAESRPSTIHVPPPILPNVDPPERGDTFMHIPGVTPNFVQHFDLCWVIGQKPMSHSKISEMGAWIRFKQPEILSEHHIVTLMDVMPPGVLQMFAEMKPVSSLTWHLQFLDGIQNVKERDPEAWWFFHVKTMAAHAGYAQQQANLFDINGRAVAMCQQSIAVFG